MVIVTAKLKGPDVRSRNQVVVLLQKILYGLAWSWRHRLHEKLSDAGYKESRKKTHAYIIIV